MEIVRRDNASFKRKVLLSGKADDGISSGKYVSLGRNVGEL